MHDQRIAELRRKLAADPSSPDDHGQLASLLLDRARQVQTEAMARMQDASARASAYYSQALSHARAASRLRPTSAQAQHLCGILLREIGDLNAAHAAFEAAYGIAPHHPFIAADYAASLQGRVGADSARQIYEKALQEHPGHAALHAGFALILLGNGEFARGWDEYEWRLQVQDAGIARPFPFPVWAGEPIGGRTVFVYSEQGLGDEIMFASCYDELIGLAGHCVLEVSYRLAPLFRRSFPRATVIERSLSKPHDWSRLPRIDVQIAAGSLPRFFRRSWDAFRPHIGYLQADAARTLRWRKAVHELGSGLKVGLAWKGGLPGTLRAARSVRLADLTPLLAAKGARFIALELTDPQAEFASLAVDMAVKPVWWPQATRDPDELAALLANLDLIISVTTASAHLAGALGRPLWVLVPTVPTWRYLWSGERMPWYPSATVLRRQRAESLETYVAGLARALERWPR
jgi:hypothetical protein